MATMMKLPIWAVRLVVFLFLFVFAAQNTAPVEVHLLLGRAWNVPLVIVLLSSFVVGAVLGALSLSGVLYRQRREIARLRQPVKVTHPPAEF